MADQALLRAEDVTVAFRLGRGSSRRRARLVAVNSVTFEIQRGETLAIVGESGSGKSTTARAVMRLVDIESGRVALDGEDLTALSPRQFRPMRKRIQMVFQDPYSSLDPSMVIAESIAEPLAVHTEMDSRARHRRVAELLELVGLSRDHLDRYPYEFSGGQRQRIAIARAISSGPDLVVCDEAVSALDVSTQNQIINLLEDLQSELSVSYLFISHDLAVVRHIAHRVAVMYLGRIVEHGPVSRIFADPKHPYTIALLSAVPVPDPGLQRSSSRIVLRGDVPDPTNPPSGCPFHTRCPSAHDACREAMPPSVAVAGGGSVSCWLHVESPATATAVAVADLQAAT